MTVVRRSTTTAKRGPMGRLIRKDGKERKSSSHKPGRKPHGNKAKRSAGRKLYSYRQRKSDGSLSFPKKRGPAKSKSRSRSRSPARSKSRSTKLNPWAEYLRKYFKAHKTGTFKARVKAASREYQKKNRSKKSGSKGKKRGPKKSKGSKGKKRGPKKSKGSKGKRKTRKSAAKKSSSTPKKKKSSGNPRPGIPHHARATMFGLPSQQVGTVKTHNGRRYTAVKSADGSYMWRAAAVRK